VVARLFFTYLLANIDNKYRISNMFGLEELEPLLKTFWYVAAPTSIVFIIQTIMTFLGGHTDDISDTEIHTDTDSHSPLLEWFSLRNLINFLLGFSWTGISFYNTIDSQIILLLLSMGVGASFVWIFFVMVKQIQKLAEDNSFRVTSTLYQTAEVYLTIPANRTGNGKILISINGSIHELTAASDKELIESGAKVRVIDIEDNNILIVEKIQEEELL
jgi:membrane protein implicated in regulation of membrane protease activity